MQRFLSFSSRFFPCHRKFKAFSRIPTSSLGIFPGNFGDFEVFFPYKCKGLSAFYSLIFGVTEFYVPRDSSKIAIDKKIAFLRRILG
jgi:hypothetical protein